MPVVFILTCCLSLRPLSLNMPAVLRRASFPHRARRPSLCLFPTHRQSPSSSFLHISFPPIHLQPSFPQSPPVSRVPRPQSGDGIKVG
ncbi:hypothetical protein F5Y15DRAFT_401737 [Xylariaceae sp. FL0016]|nr:hypothetical protein F5Y15DRAFT_401737 [Xylariaceae sp. FL0016]